MSTNRKLMRDVEATLKKVDEGIELFDEVWEKVYSASQQSQKEKYELDLKKEIKKLQRHRDQIKSWATNNDIKDKSKLLEARKRIEEKMEQFKRCERETKTKAYSKEGLAKAAKLDPESKKRNQVRNWVQEKMQQLTEQVEGFEADIEVLMSGTKLQKKDQLTLTDLENKIKQHTWHIEKLEMITRALDNEVIDPNEVDDLKDEVEYFVESHNDPDFYHDEQLYEQLDLEEKLSQAGKTVSLEVAPSKTTKRKEKDDSKTPKKSKKDNKAASTASPAKPKGKSEDKSSSKTAHQQLLEQQQQRQKLLAQQQAAQKAKKEQQQREREREQQLFQDERVQQVREDQSPSPQEDQEDDIDDDEEEEEAQQQQQAARQEQQQQQREEQLKQEQQLQQQQHQLQQQRQQEAARQAQAQLQKQQQAMPPQPQLDQRQLQSQSARPLDDLIDPSSDHPGQVLDNHRLNLPQQQPQVVQPQAPHLVSQHSSGIAQQQQGGASAQQQQQPPQARLARVGGSSAIPIMSEHRQRLALLDSSLLTIPDASDSERPKVYVPARPSAVPQAFPSVPAPIFESPQFFEKLNLDTLFFIFYHQQGSYQQYLAARELKRLSWRYHKKYLTWFQRRDQPKVKTDEYEIGTYIYFDHETGWCQRIKSEFTFEYSYLEDELSK